MSTTRYLDAKQETVAPSHAIIERIAALEEVEYTEIDPLIEAIDPDALDTLVEETEQTDSTLEIEFTYSGYNVTVTGEGEVHIDEAIPTER